MITATSNPTIKAIKKLEQKKYRIQFQASLIYNDKVITEAVKAQQVLCLIDTKDHDGFATLVVNELVLKYLHPHHHADLLAIVNHHQVQPITTDQVLVLDHIQDPGNLGTMLRSAYAFGIKDVVVSPHSCDLYSPKIMISSAGSYFHMNIVEMELSQYLKTSDLPTIMSFLDLPSSEQFPKTFNLVIGSENHGIDQALKSYCDYNYVIPTKFESLNVSVACGIMLANLC